MGDMPMGSMSNLTGSPIPGTDYVSADSKLARMGYPWCVTALPTAYFLDSKWETVTQTPKYNEYSFQLNEDWDLCKTLMTKRKKLKAINKQCNTPFYSFMLAISMECHQAVMSVTSVRMYTQQNMPGAPLNEMYAHAHKGHDTGVPLLKYLIKPESLSPAPGVKRSWTLSIRLFKSANNTCSDMHKLCGGNTCMAALSDEEYDVCPAFFSEHDHKA
ncbi:hypothetical protein HYH03_008428 [Edaphochlamys debaryana]|uniref:Uncharacterized protein n=1 Tax=Edaphochlamys debaryana TaxID=47281 RepID=A0A835XY89_9CHLO|nr:hypothetical protein HYH03_008428 [Edaphochlamys debaryana]|eukprot:KAG2493292.1 hypothetical protein HYH03_008428 [Edaphochlamys debaryana]